MKITFIISSILLTLVLLGALQVGRKRLKVQPDTEFIAFLLTIFMAFTGVAGAKMTDFLLSTYFDSQNMWINGIYYLIPFFLIYLFVVPRFNKTKICS